MPLSKKQALEKIYGADYWEALRLIEECIIEGKKELDLSRKSGLKQLPKQVEQISNLQELDLSGTQVDNGLDLSVVPNLKTLNLANTQVDGQLKLPPLNNLQLLNLSRTQVDSDLDLSVISNLQELDLSGTQVDNGLDLSVVPNLKTLSLPGTQVDNGLDLSVVPNLKSLNLSGKKIDNGLNLSVVPNLQHLYLSYTQVDNGLDLSVIPNLKTLSLQGTQVDNGLDLSVVPNLKTLDLRYTQVDGQLKLPQLNNLRELELGDTQVDGQLKLPQLQNLKTLDLRYTQVDGQLKLPQLQNLQTLNLSWTQVDGQLKLPQLPNLQTLNLNYTQVDGQLKLPQLQNLQTLSLIETQVDGQLKLPQLNNLLRIDLNWTQVDNNLDLSIAPNLQKLDLSNTLVDGQLKLPQLNNLQELELLHTQVDGQLKLPLLNNLKILDLSHTLVDGQLKLPQLNNLLLLHLSSTEIKNCLDLDLSIFPNLKSLSLRDTFQKQLPPELYKDTWNCLPNIHAWRADLERGRHPNDLYKVQICGNGTVGKSSLIDRLLFNRYMEGRSSTHGIRLVINEEAKSFATNCPPIRLLAWDFGGQDIYHQAHRIFLRDRTINLLVFDAATYYNPTQRDPVTGQQDYNRKLSYWLNDIAANAPDSQIIIVQNKCEEGVSPISIQNDLLPEIQVVGPLYVSAKTDHLGKLKRVIHNAIQQLPHAEMDMPKSWFLVREEIIGYQKRKAPKCITRFEFSALCHKFKLVPNSESALLTYLDGLGLLLHDPNLLPDQVIIDQEWALNAIYTVLQRFNLSKPLSLAKRGIFAFQEKCRLDNGQFISRDIPFDPDQYTTEEQGFFLKIMQRAGICFETQVKKDDSPIFQLFYLMATAPTSAAEDVWADAAGQPEFTQRYLHKYHLHRGIFRDLVQQISSKVKLRHLWQDGLLLQLPDSTIARLEMHYSSDYLQLQARGSQATELLLYCNDLLDKLLLGDQYFQKQVSLDGKIFFPIMAIQDAIKAKSELAKGVDGQFHNNWETLTWTVTPVDKDSKYDFNNLPTVTHEPAPYLGISDQDVIEDLERRNREKHPLPIDTSEEQANHFQQAQQSIHIAEGANVSFISGEIINHNTDPIPSPSSARENTFRAIHWRALLQVIPITVLVGILFYYLLPTFREWTLIASVLTLCLTVIWALNRQPFLRRIGNLLITAGIGGFTILNGLPLIDGFLDLDLDLKWLNANFIGRLAIDSPLLFNLGYLSITIGGGLLCIYWDQKQEGGS
jgi:hypothetical protein